MEPFTAPVSALFVDTHNSLSTAGGGVQVFTRDALTTLTAAGFALTTVPFELDRRLRTRVMHRVRPTLRATVVPPDLAHLVERAVEAHEARYVFFGATRFVALSRRLRGRFPDLFQVLVSQGIEAIDFCLDQQMRRRTGQENRPRTQVSRMLGEDLLDEAEQRRHIDAVLCLSPFEEEIETWLGAPAVRWIPRAITEAPLEWHAVQDRVGCVSTLDHSPNRDGLVQLFEALAAMPGQPIRFRLVGQPEHEGQRLAATYPFVDYVGGLDDAMLRREASTWCCFVHPLFVYAKGCSTKLAVGLGWRLPIATTVFGARGYCWNEDALPLFRTPAELAAGIVERSHADKVQHFQRQTLAIVAQTPTIRAVADDLRQFLFGLSREAGLAARQPGSAWATRRTVLGSEIAG